MLEHFRVEMPFQLNERVVILSISEFLTLAQRVFSQEVIEVQDPCATGSTRMSLRTFRRRRSAHLFSPLFQYFNENITQVLEWDQAVSLEDHEKFLVQVLRDPEQHQKFCTLLLQLSLIGYLVLNPGKAKMTGVAGGACLALNRLPSYLVQHLNYLTLTPNGSVFGFTEYNPCTFEFRNIFKPLSQQI